MKKTRYFYSIIKSQQKSTYFFIIFLKKSIDFWFFSWYYGVQKSFFFSAGFSTERVSFFVFSSQAFQLEKQISPPRQTLRCSCGAAPDFSLFYYMPTPMSMPFHHICLVGITNSKSIQCNCVIQNTNHPCGWQLIFAVA